MKHLPQIEMDQLDVSLFMVARIRDEPFDAFLEYSPQVSRVKRTVCLYTSSLQQRQFLCFSLSLFLSFLRNVSANKYINMSKCQA